MRGGRPERARLSSGNAPNIDDGKLSSAEMPSSARSASSSAELPGRVRAKRASDLNQDPHMRGAVIIGRAEMIAQAVAEERRTT